MKSSTDEKNFTFLLGTEEVVLAQDLEAIVNELNALTVRLGSLPAGAPSITHRSTSLLLVLLEQNGASIRFVDDGGV